MTDEEKRMQAYRFTALLELMLREQQVCDAELLDMIAPAISKFQDATLIAQRRVMGMH